MNVFIYFISCFLSGMIELGTILWGIKNDFSVIQCVGIAFAYQMGNIILYFITKKTSQCKVVLLPLSIVLGISSIFLQNDKKTLYIVALLMFMFLSICIQLTRESVKRQIKGLKKWQKRSCRVVGFFASAIMFTNLGTYVYILCAVMLFIFAFIIPTFGFDEWHRKVRSKEIKSPVCYAMITHQAHYFVYTYVLLVLVYMHYQSAIIASIWFVANWIPYTITEPLAKALKIDKYYYPMGIIAHFFNGVILITMWAFSIKDNIFMTALFWMLTGFGGGTVFCVRSAIAKVKKYDNDSWMFSEQIGHILGMVACVIICLFNLKATMLAGAFFALITIPIIIATIKKAKVEV